jgi:6-phosphogluconolactonase
MNHVSVPARSGARGGWVRRSLVVCALIGLPFAVISCGGGDDNGGGGGGGGNNPPGGGGGGGASTATQFAYVIQSAADQINALRADADGTLTQIGGPPLATGDFPHHVDVDPRGRFVYVANHNSPFLSGYRINQDGSLAPMNTLVAGSPVTGLTLPPDPAEAGSHSSVIDQSGQFLYVVAGPETGAPSTLKAYRIDTNQGATLGNLTALTGAGSSFPVGVHAHNITLSPNNLFVYVASDGSGEVHAFRRDTSTGALTPAGPAITGLNAPAAVTVSPDSRFLYATVLNSVEVFSIDQTSGALTRVAPPTPFTTGNGPHSITIHPDGRTLYTANLNTNDVTVLRVDTNTGTLTVLENEPTGGSPNYLVIHPNQRTLYTADAAAARVSRFTINADGTLEPATVGTTFPAGSGTNGIGTTKFP